MPNRVVRIREAAARLGYHPKTLQTMCSEGRSPVPCAKRNDARNAEWVFSDEDLTRYVTDLFSGAGPSRTAASDLVDRSPSGDPAVA